MAEELKPCPWCGGTPSGAVIHGSTFRWRRVEGCCVDGPEVRHVPTTDGTDAEADSRRRAIASWNDRPDDKDAARYRWLRDHNAQIISPNAYGYQVRWVSGLALMHGPTRDTYDAAVDAARGAGK